MQVCVCGDTVGVVDVVLESNQTQLFFTPLHLPKTPLKVLFWVFIWFYICSRERPQWPILLGKQQCFCCGEISPKIDLQNMISTYTKDFSWRNDPYSPVPPKKKTQKNIQIARFL